MTYILYSIDLYLTGHADNVLNLSWSLHGLEANFIKFQQEYAHIGLQFNAEKYEVLLVNSKSDAVRNIAQCDSIVELTDDIVYLGLPNKRSML